jgi:nitroreductase
VDQALEVGLQAPSACNRQPFRFIIVDEPELVQKVAQIPMGTAGYAHGIPMLVVAVGQLRAFHSERDRHLIYIDTSLALMGFQLALETIGLSSCSINWPAIPEKEAAIRKVLALEPDEQTVMLVAVGYADETGAIPFSQKKPLSEARSYNR